MDISNRKKKMYKSAYFWGFLLGLIFVILNVLALPVIYKHSENQIRKVDFSKLVITRLNGETVTLKELSNSRKVVINFWATWCKPCLVELPIMESAYQSVKHDYVFVMINDEKKETTIRYRNKNNYSFEFVYMDRSDFVKYGIVERPATLLLDANLNITNVIIGEISQKNGEDFIGFLNEHN